MDHGRPISSFWGNVSYIGKSFRDPSKVMVSMGDVTFSIEGSDPSVSAFRVTSGAKKTFVVLETMNHRNDTRRVLAVYRHPKADNRLVLSIRELIDHGEITMDDLDSWHPDYLHEPAE